MKTNPFLRRWGMPLLMAVMILFGLLSALLGSGAWQTLSRIALAVPVIVMIRYAFRSRRPSKDRWS